MSFSFRCSVEARADREIVSLQKHHPTVRSCSQKYRQAPIPSTWSEPAAAVISEASILRIKPPLSLETRTSLALRFPLANVGETPDERRQTHAQCEARSC